MAFYSLAADRKPPILELRRAGASIAVATDCNPGSAPGASLLLAMSMGARLFGLTAEESLAAVTRNAARAAGIHLEYGLLKEGYAADFVIWNVRSLDELGYWVGFNPSRSVVKAAEIVAGQDSFSGPFRARASVAE